MLKVALIGLGFMGKMHLDNYIRLESEGFPVKLVAICDVDQKKLDGELTGGNIATGEGKVDMSRFNLYKDVDVMLEKEQIDYLDITLPTYLHAEVTIKALEKGLNVFCEKPMALKSADCQKMIDTAKRKGKKLMIGQCLRFWPEYEYLKECIETGRFGKVISGYFYRGGTTPTWSWDNWLLQEAKSGGALMDQHIHDVDTINWLFGKPAKVSTIARNVVKGSGYDVVSTNYIYDDGKVVNAQDDWTLNGDYGFQMIFRVNFEKGNVILGENGFKVNPNEGKSFTPDLSKDIGYYWELKYFINSIINDTPITTASPESTMETIRIAEAELLSAKQNGETVKL